MPLLGLCFTVREIGVLLLSSRMRGHFLELEETHRSRYSSLLFSRWKKKACFSRWEKKACITCIRGAVVPPGFTTRSQVNKTSTWVSWQSGPLSTSLYCSEDRTGRPVPSLKERATRFSSELLWLWSVGEVFQGLPVFYLYNYHFYSWFSV